MSAVQFHCPLCEGLFQVDDALAGIQVNCPHCEGLVTVPSFDAEPPPLAGDLFQLSCPICEGEFKVPAEAAGQEVSCPHCYGVVAVPSLSGDDSAEPPPAPVPQLMHFPPGVAPPPPNRNQPQVRESRPSRQTSPEVHSPALAESLLPPPTADRGEALDRKPLPAAIREKRETVLIPTEQGLVGVHEPVKTIQLRGEEVELRRLSPEEKSRRRGLRNGILFVLCVVALIGVMAALKIWS